MPDQASAQKADGETAFNQILEKVTRRPLDDFTERLKELQKEQSEKIKELGTAVQEQASALGSAQQAVRSLDSQIRTDLLSRVNDLKTSVDELASSQHELQQQVTSFAAELHTTLRQHAKSVAEDGDHRLAAVTDSLSAAVAEGNGQLSTSLRDYLAAETGSIRSQLATLEEERKSSGGLSPFLAISGVVLLILQVVLVALVATRH